MDNQELLSQVGELIKQQSQIFSDQLSSINQRLDSVENEIKGVRLDMEHNVAKRIEVLFDGYKLTHEKQWEQDRIIQELQLKLEEVQIRLLALENKSA